MMTFPGNALKSMAARTVVFAAFAGACASASAALPPFTFNPVAGGITGAPAGTFTADNVLVSDFSTVTSSGTTFNDTGYLSVSAFQLGGNTFTPTGFNSTYGMYIAFNGSGTQGIADPTTSVTTGSFTSLSYTLYGFSGTATFGFSGNTPTVSTSGAPVVLATGSLINGTAGTIPAGGGTFTPFANATLSFNVVDTPFFASPSPFYNQALSAFINTTSEVEPFAGGFRIRQGGGSFNYVATPVPEPSTYGLLLAGLGVVGFVARRRKA